MESNAFMKSVVASHILTTPLLAFLFNHPVCCQMVQRLVRTTEPTLIPLVAFGRVWRKACCSRWPRTVCIAQAKYKLDGRILRHVSGVQLSCFNTSFKISFITSFVASSQVLMPSARIPLLSLALPCLSLSIAACISSSVIANIFHYFPHHCFPRLHQFFFQDSRRKTGFTSIVCVLFAVEFSEDIGNTISRCNCGTFVIPDF